MILDGIIIFIAGILQIIVNSFPVADPTVNTNINSSFLSIRDALVQANWIFPIDTLYRLLRLGSVTILIFLGFRLIRWIASNLSGGLFK